MYNTHLQNTFVGWDMLATKSVWYVHQTPNSTYSNVMVVVVVIVVAAGPL